MTVYVCELCVKTDKILLLLNIVTYYCHHTSLFAYVPNNKINIYIIIVTRTVACS